MKQMSVKWLMLMAAACFALEGCTQLDNYMLGKDNSPKPAPLAPIVSKAHMSVVWTTSIGSKKKSNPYFKLKPVIRESVVYTADSSGIVSAINKKNGQILWSKKLDYGVISGPTVAKGYIALGMNSSHVLLLKQSDGSVVWKATVSSDVLSKPAISHNKVIAKTIDGNLYAFDLRTGEKIWVLDHGSPHLILKASSSPVIRGEQILVGFSDGKLDAVDIQFGRQIWQKSIAYANGASDVERLVDIDADPVVRGDTIYLASYQGYIGALTLENGQFLWTKPASTYRNLAIDGNTLYMTASDDVLWAFDRQTGQVKWKQPALKARGLSEPVLIGNRLIVGDNTGYLHLVSTDNGEILSRIMLSGSVSVSPSVSGHVVYVMTDNGQLNCISVSA
jgi:outer membrane protein assembly factor BamB